MTSFRAASLEIGRGIIMKVCAIVGLVLAVIVGGCSSVRTQQLVREEPADKVLLVRQTEDFVISGRGDASAWMKANWERLHLRNADGHQYETRIKMLYSKSGLYVLMEAEDRTITAAMNEDFLDLWNEDVFEFFLWPDEQYPVYFEYEISSLGFELPILIPKATPPERLCRSREGGFRR